MDTYVLFWRSLFGLEPQPVWDLPDPFGLIQSRAAVGPGAALRLTFNVSGAADTSTNRFVSAFSGAGVHHVAFATADAAGTVAAMRAADAPLLPIPDNYFDDVEARLSLEPEETAELRAHGLLYDRDGAGEFRHAYTANFEGRFFFEVVERGPGYGGFGAANAAVRMAAQAVNA